jgi:hypothetical protein
MRAVIYSIIPGGKMHRLHIVSMLEALLNFAFSSLAMSIFLGAGVHSSRSQAVTKHHAQREQGHHAGWHDLARVHEPERTENHL